MSGMVLPDTSRRNAQIMRKGMYGSGLEKAVNYKYREQAESEEQDHKNVFKIEGNSAI